MEMTVEQFLENSLQLAKQENVNQEEIILFNVKHLESSIRGSKSIINELRAALPCFEAKIRPLKILVRNLSKETPTPEIRKALSKNNKLLNNLRSLYSQGQHDIAQFREALKRDHEGLELVLTALREFYKQNPDSGCKA